MKFIISMFLALLFASFLTLAYDLGKLERFVWQSNQPDATHVHKDKVCFEWETKYKTKLIACVKRGE